MKYAPTYLKRCTFYNGYVIFALHDKFCILAVDGDYPQIDLILDKTRF